MRQPEKEAAKVSVGLILVLAVVLLAMVGMAVLAYTSDAAFEGRCTSAVPHALGLFCGIAMKPRAG